MPCPSEVDDALDAVSDVVKESIFHVLETVWALVCEEGISKDRFFHLFGALRLLRDTLAVCKGGASHTLPVATVDSRQIARVVTWRFTCLLPVADSPEL